MKLFSPCQLSGYDWIAYFSNTSIANLSWTIMKNASIYLSNAAPSWVVNIRSNNLRVYSLQYLNSGIDETLRQVHFKCKLADDGMGDRIQLTLGFCMLLRTTPA